MPTIAETLPDFVSSTWVGIFLPPKTPQAIADKINADVNEALKQPEIALRFRRERLRAARHHNGCSRPTSCAQRRKSGPR